MIVSVCENGYCIIKKKGKFGYINNVGVEICDCKYDIFEPFCNGFAIIGIYNIFGKIARFGFINEVGEEICDCKYSKCYNFSSRLGINKNEYLLSLVSLNGKEDYMDTDGNLKTNFKYDYVYQFGYDFTHNQSYALVLNNKKFGFIDGYFKEVVKCEYDDNKDAKYVLEKYKFNQNRIQKLKIII